MITIAQAWCVTKPDARLAIGVPTNVNGRDRIEFNAHRVYGPILYPYLVTNWRFIWPLEGEAAPATDILQTFQFQMNRESTQQDQLRTNQFLSFPSSRCQMIRS
jgi:hypothetical protein